MTRSSVGTTSGLTHGALSLIGFNGKLFPDVTLRNSAFLPTRVKQSLPASVQSIKPAAMPFSFRSLIKPFDAKLYLTDNELEARRTKTLNTGAAYILLAGGLAAYYKGSFAVPVAGMSFASLARAIDLTLPLIDRKDASRKIADGNYPERIRLAMLVLELDCDFEERAASQVQDSSFLADALPGLAFTSFTSAADPRLKDRMYKTWTLLCEMEALLRQLNVKNASPLWTHHIAQARQFQAFERSIKWSPPGAHVDRNAAGQWTLVHDGLHRKDLPPGPHEPAHGLTPQGLHPDHHHIPYPVQPSARR